MIKEASGPINFTVFLTMFGEKLKGGSAPPLPELTCILTSPDVTLLKHLPAYR